MSKSNGQYQGKLKANIEEFIEPLLKHLAHCRGDPIVEKICKLVEENKDVVESRHKENNEKINLFGEIERLIDQWEENKGDYSELIQNFTKLLQKHRVNMSNDQDVTNFPGPSYNSKQENEENEENDVFAKLEELDPRQKDFFCSFGILFSKNVKLKKRLLVYWWIGLGLVPLEGNTNTTLEQQGEKIFSDLVEKGILKPVYTRKHNEVIDQCILDPTLHRQLIHQHQQLNSAYYQGKQELVIDKNVFLNVDHKYLSSKKIKKICSDKNAKTLQVVQLGRWNCTDIDDKIINKRNKSQDHIEVDDTDFLKKFGGNVTYVSLRGISGIDRLPELIGKLGDLRILDLRSCHNLEKLPQKRHLRLIKGKKKWLKNLTHLDVSECYLLDHMPKWICELSNLEVLKGFTTSSKGKKNEFCRLSDLSKLKKLRKLGIKITKPIDDPNDAKGLESLDLLSRVTIIWDIHERSNEEGTILTICFPERLEKLDIRCYPEAEVTKLLPEVLPYLKRLYIRGGNLKKLGLHNSWKVEILRLRFLEDLESDWTEIIGIFPNLKSIEYEECPNLIGFPFRGGAWNTKTDGPFPIIDDDYPETVNLEAPLVPKDISGRVELKIISNMEAPLDKNEQSLMIKLTASSLCKDGPGLDLVAVIDVGERMKEDKLENMKAALRFVIAELNGADRFSIITYAYNAAEVLWPLQKVTKHIKKKLKDLVNNLKAQPQDTEDKKETSYVKGTTMALDMLNDPKIGSQSKVKSIMLVCTRCDWGPDLDKSVGVALHAFGFGKDHKPVVLMEFAALFRGGTYSDVTNTNNLTKAVAVCLAGLHAVVVQELKLTLIKFPQDQYVKRVKLVGQHQYKRFDEEPLGSLSTTINFGELYSSEVRKVVIKLFLPVVLEEGSTDVFKVSYSYELSGQIFTSKPVIFSIKRMKTVSVQKQQAPREVIAEETRCYMIEDILFDIRRPSKDDAKLISALKSLENLDDEWSEALRDELKEIAISHNIDRAAFSMSLYCSHFVQRAATRGDDIEKSIRSFGNPIMFRYLKRAGNMRYWHE